jgi:hypothetical protein
VGGAAMGGGQRYQARVLAWWSARILLQTRLGGIFDLPATAVAERVWAETTDSVDDARVGFSSGHRLFGQCKTTIAIGIDIHGPWANALGQCAEEFDRALHAGTESQVRLIVFFENDNRNATRLAKLLDRFRHEADDELGSVARSDQDHVLATELNALLDTLRTEASTKAGADRFAFLGANRAAFLRRLFVHQLRLAPGQTDYLSVVDALQGGLLENAAQSTAAVASLHGLADDLIAEYGTRDRAGLRNRLQGEDIPLRESPDFRADFERLDAWTNDQIAAHEAEGRDRIRVGTTSVSLDRGIVAVVEGIDDSLLVVGDAGSGKSGVLLDLVRRWRAEGRQVWYWAADALAHQSLPELAATLQLRHPWSAIIAEARPAGVVLVIDGLDGIRDAREQKAYRELLQLAQRAGAQVVASIRTFDVRYAPDLRNAFPRVSGSELPTGDALAANVAHVVVPSLDENDITTVATQLPAVKDVLQRAPSLRDVVRNLFSLDLLCRLLDGGVTVDELTDITTQAQLFDRYWDRRITASSRQGTVEEALRSIVGRMVAGRSLQTDAQGIEAEALRELQSNGILRVPPTPAGRLPSMNRLEFGHHVLFDYVAERVFVRARRARLAGEFASGDAWPLFLRPSIVLFHRYAWQNGRLDFWETLLDIERADVSGLHRFAAYLVVADSALNREDLQPLFDGVSAGDGAKHWRQALRGVVNAVTHRRLRQLLESGGGCWWLQFGEDLIATDDRELVYVGRRLMFTAADVVEKPDVDCRRFLNRSARLLIEFHRREGNTTLGARPPIEWLARTYSADPVGSAKAIRTMLEPGELARAGFLQVPALANGTESLAAAAPSLTRELYAAAFEFDERSQRPTPMGSGVMPMRSNRRQDFEHARYLLDRFFPAFLTASPAEATRAVIRLAARPLRDGATAPSGAREEFRLAGQNCNVISDPMRRMQLEHHAGHYAGQILDKWAAWVGTVDPVENAATLDEVLALLASENDSAAVWAHLVQAATAAVESEQRAGRFGPACEWAARLTDALTSPAFLAGKALDDVAPPCLAAVAPLLAETDVRRIEETIFALSEGLFSDYREPSKRLRNTQGYLLQQIPPESRSERTVEFLNSFHDESPRAPDGIPRIFTSSRAVTTESLFADQGIDVSESVNAELLESIRELETVLSSDANETEAAEGNPDDEGAARAEVEDDDQEVDSGDEASSVGDLEVQGDESATPLEVIDRAEQRLRERRGGDAAVRDTLAAEILRRRAEFVDAAGHSFPNERVDEFIEQFSAALAAPAEPLNERGAEQFDEMQSWPTADRRISGARGIMALAVRKGVRLPVIKDVIAAAARDPDARVRSHVAMQIWPLLEEWPDLVWALVEGWVADLREMPGAAGVLKSVARSGWFWWLRHRDSDRADQVLKDLADAARSRGDGELQELAGRYLAVLWFRKQVAWARDRLLSGRGDLSESISEVAGGFRELLDAALPDTKDDFGEGERVAARDLACALLPATRDALAAYDQSLRAMKPEDRPLENPQWVESLAGIGSSLGRQLEQSAEYIGKQADEEREVAVATWWRLAEPLLEELLRLPLVESFHSAIEAVVHVAPFAPKRALRWIAKLVIAGEQIGASGESMIADRVIAFLARTLATEGGTLASDDEVRADFLTALDVILRVGWPGAIELALKIETLFR